MRKKLPIGIENFTAEYSVAPEPRNIHRILNDQNSDIHYSLIESSFVWLLRCGVMKNPRQALRLGGGNAYCDCAAGDFSNVSSM